MTTQTATYKVEITGYGAGGEGVGRLPDGRAVFVPRAARGDVLALRLREEKARSARGEIDRILTPSPWRIEADCPVYPRCGGCDFRHITYEEELQAKLKRVNDALAHIGGLSAAADEILTTGQTEGYRNKAVLHTDGVSYGFYASQSREIVPVDRCPLLKEDLNTALKDLPRTPQTQRT
ncbi:MAG: TRAM domain-containing protein, partial [Clostridiales bacterium]|nr:TRAM domain-containing protein [Clostridiales bacterium]